MANSRRKCGYCGERKKAEDMFIFGPQAFCNRDHYIENQVKNKDKLIKKGREIQAKQERKAHQQRKKEVKPLKWWQDTLQALVNQWVMQVRDKGKPCATCGNPEAKECGHWHSRGSRPDIRYNLYNLAPQCHVCNVYKSGNKAEYDKYIVQRWGLDVFVDLNKQTKTLKDQFPHWTDYELEIKHYRNLLREHGIKPCR